MGTKQLRITGMAQISNRISEFLGKQINVVLNNNTTMVGTLQGVKEDQVILKTMRLKSITFPLHTVIEIYSDTKA